MSAFTNIYGIRVPLSSLCHLNIMTTLFIPATNLIERDFHFLNGVGLFSE